MNGDKISTQLKLELQNFLGEIESRSIVGDEEELEMIKEMIECF